MYDFYKNRKKSDYIIYTGRSKMLDSGLLENQVWGALHKAWKGYVIAIFIVASTSWSWNSYCCS
jgi:hypothetical protein